jgi:hypothetical protein
MPDPNFRELIQRPQAKRVPDPDFRAVAGDDRGPQLPLVTLPDSAANASTPDEARDHTRKVMYQFGYDAATIDSLTVPPGGHRVPPAGTPPFNPVSEQARVPAHESMKIERQLQSEGQVLDRRDSENLHDGIMAIAAAAPGVALAGLAEGRGWLNNLYDAAADRATGLLSGTLLDLSLGTALLDTMNYVYKKYKIDGLKLGNLQIVPPGARIPLPGDAYLEMPGVRDAADRAAMELRMLPKITLTRYGERFSSEHPQEFGNSAYAAMYYIGERTRGRAEKFAGKITGNEALQEKGEQRTQFVESAVPPFVASLGEYPMWQDIEEANMTEEELNHRYKWIADHGTTGQAAALAMSFGTALSEMIGDPSMVLGALPGQLATAGRVVLRNRYPLEYAQGLANVAKRTHRIEDVLTAHNASRTNLQRAQVDAAKVLVGTGEHADIDAVRKVIVAKRAHAVNTEFLGYFDAPGPHENILLRTAKRHPDTMPDPVAPVRAAPPMAAQLSPTQAAYDKAATRFREIFNEMGGGLEVEPLALAPDAPSGRFVKTTVSGKRIELYKDPTKQEYVLTVKGAGTRAARKELTERFPYKNVVPFRQPKRTAFLEPNLTEAKAGALAPETAIGDLERYADDATLAPKAPVDTRYELMKMQKRALLRDYDVALQWDVDSNAFKHRQLFGPDGAEEAGDALNLLTRTGGMGIDDVALHETFPEYNTSSPATGISHTNWAQIDAVNELTKAERELQKFPAGTKGMEIGQYPVRVLARQRGITRQAMGAARQAGDRAAYGLHGRRLRRVEKAMERVLEVNKGKMDRLQKYDDSWLPRAYTGRTHTPEKYNRWLQLGQQDNRVVRSLVPGGLRLSGYWFTPMGQVHSLAREPMRFFRNYSPDTWDMVQGTYLDFNEATDAWNRQIYEILKEGGVLKDRAKFDPKKHWAPYETDEPRSTLLFDMLDTDPDRVPDLQWETALDPSFNHLAHIARGDEKLLAAHTKIRKLLDHAADQQGITGTPKYLTNYMRHMITSDQFANGMRPLEYIGLPVNGEVFVSHLQTRTGARAYVKDLTTALDFYGRAMNRKLYLEPMFEHVSNRVGRELAKKHGNTALQSYCSDLVLELKGRPSFLGTKIDNAMGSPVNQAMRAAQKIPGINRIPGVKNWSGYRAGAEERMAMGVTNLAYMGMIVGNPRYGVMQMATGTTTTASRLGLFRTLRGVLEFATPEGQTINRAIGSYKPFIDLFEDPTWRKLSTILTEKGKAITPLGILSNAKAEEVVRGISAFAAVDMMLTKYGFSTWDEAVEAGASKLIAFRALQISQETNHLYGPLGRSPFISRLFGRANAAFATQFLSFTWKQTDELLSQFADDPSRIFQYLAVSGYVARMAAVSGGMDLTDYTGFGYLPKRVGDVTSPGIDEFINLVDLADALGGRDVEKVHKGVKEVTRGLVGFIPMSQAVQSAMKTAERIETGVLKTATGSYVRPMDFAQTLSKQEGQHWLMSVAESIRPEGRPNEALGGELLATAFGQRNIQEALTRRANDAIRMETKTHQFRRQQLVEEYVHALEANDQDRVNELSKTLLDVHKVRFTSGDPIRRAIEARALLQRWKLMDPEWGGDPQLYDKYLFYMNAYGVGMEN